MPRLVISASRDGSPYVEPWLARWQRKYGRPELLILGDAPGGDAQAYHYGHRQRWDIAVMIALWEELGRKRAGGERNERMVALARAADHFLGFPGPESQGTYGCHALAMAAGLACWMAPVAPPGRALRIPNPISGRR